MTLANDAIASWSNICKTKTQLADFSTAAVSGENRFYIPRGAGQSFGDAAFLSGGSSLGSAPLAELGIIDKASGVCRFGAGVTMLAMHRYLAEQHYQFPIYGGNQRVTLGGAVASDIHGKNHFYEGSFGHHVAALEVWTHQGAITCSHQDNADLFRATIGGMGLTGMILAVVLKVRPRTCTHLVQTRSHLHSLPDMFEQFEQAPGAYQFASWLDMTADKPVGLYYTARACTDAEYVAERRTMKPLRSMLNIGCMPRIGLISSTTMRLAAQLAELFPEKKEKCLSALQFNYSGVHERFQQWNYLMGPSGMIEYQFCLPDADFSPALKHIVDDARSEKIALLSSVVKRFGEHEPAGLLSFPRAGYGINFQLQADTDSFAFLSRCSDYLNQLGGRFYLAKDACLSAAQFAQSCPELPQWQRIVQRFDPHHQVRSDLSQRLQLKHW